MPALAIGQCIPKERCTACNLTKTGKYIITKYARRYQRLTSACPIFRYIIGESDGKGNIPPFVLVAYKGHTLQGNYEGSFVYSKEPILPEAAIPAVRDAASKAGLNWDDYTRIDNTW